METEEYDNSKIFHVKKNRPWDDGHGGSRYKISATTGKIFGS
jgi:hypothetical protein